MERLFLSRPCLRPDGFSLVGMPVWGSLIFRGWELPVDNRFQYVSRESAPYVEWLGIQENPYGGGWAAGRSYGYKLRSLLAELKGEEYTWPESTETVEK